MSILHVLPPPGKPTPAYEFGILHPMIAFRATVNARGKNGLILEVAKQPVLASGLVGQTAIVSGKLTAALRARELGTIQGGGCIISGKGETEGRVEALVDVVERERLLGTVVSEGQFPLV